MRSRWLIVAGLALVIAAALLWRRDDAAHVDVAVMDVPVLSIPATEASVDGRRSERRPCVCVTGRTYATVRPSVVMRVSTMLHGRSLTPSSRPVRASFHQR